jgi:hypothetical protein
MADRQSQSLQGSFNKLQESAKFALGEIGTAINQELNVGSGLRAFAGFLNELKDRFMQLTPEAKEMNLKLIAIGISIGPIILGIGQLISFVNKLSKSITLLSLSGGGITKILLTLAATFAATTVAGAMYDNVMESAIKKDPALLKDVNNGLKEQIKNYDELIKKAPQAGFNPSGGQAEGTWVKGKKELIAERFKLIKQYTDNVYLIRDLEKNAKKDEPLKGLSATPPKLKPPPAEKIEIIPGIDFQTKEYGNKLKALIKENKEAGMVINAWWKDNDIKRLDELRKDYLVKKELADKEGIDILNITKKYEDAKNAIIFDAENKKVDFREKSRAKYMVVPPDTRKRTPGQQVQDAMTAALSKDKATNLENLGNALYAAQTDFANNLAGGFAEIAGSVLSGGMSIQDSFAALGSMILSSVGDYLVKAGSAAVAAGLIKEVFNDALNPLGKGTTLIASGLVAIATGTAMKQLGSSISTSQQARTSGGAMATPSIASKASGSSYQYGGSSYATQSLRLMVDLTGSITATQTGYSINKSLETTLRVTGR